MKPILTTIFILSVVCHTAIAQAPHAQQIKGDFALKNVHTGKYVRIKDANTNDGTPIVAYSPVNWKCVTWEIKPSDDRSVVLKNLLSGKTLQPKNGNAQIGIEMEEQQMGRPGQEYEFIPTNDGEPYYYIRLKGTELYLTPFDPAGATNSAIILKPRQGGDLQQWSLIEQHPTM